MTKYGLYDTYRHTKNNDCDEPGFTFCPRRMTAKPSGIDYLLISESMINKTSSLKIEIGPHIEIIQIMTICI